MFDILKRRIPFELAEPGTDPTRQRNSHPRPSWLQKNGLLVAGVLIFAIGGWWKFIRVPTPPAKSAAAPTAASTPAPATETTPSSGGFFDGGSNSVSGFLPTSEPPPPPLSTPAIVVTPVLLDTATPVATPTPQADYNVFVDGEAVLCWCDGDVEQPPECGDAVPRVCEERANEQ